VWCALRHQILCGYHKTVQEVGLQAWIQKKKMKQRRLLRKIKWCNVNLARKTDLLTFLSLSSSFLTHKLRILLFYVQVSEVAWPVHLSAKVELRSRFILLIKIPNRPILDLKITLRFHSDIYFNIVTKHSSEITVFTSFTCLFVFLT
jgi:hypothetical protein